MLQFGHHEPKFSFVDPPILIDVELVDHRRKLPLVQPLLPDLCCNLPQIPLRDPRPVPVEEAKSLPDLPLGIAFRELNSVRSVQ